MSTLSIADWLVKDENGSLEAKSETGLIHGVLLMQFGYLYEGSSSLGGGSIHACLGAVGGGGDGQGDCHCSGTCG